MPSSARNSSSHRGREGGSRRARSSSRSRSRHRERNRQRQFRFKLKERNFPAAICNMITIVILCVALAEPKWIYLTGGSCAILNGISGDLHYLGVSEFFYSGAFSLQGSQLWYQYGPKASEVLVNCVDNQAVQQIKTVIGLCFTTIIVSLIAFILDLTGPSGKVLQTLHRYAIFSIITVVMCVMINVLCYLISTQVFNLQTQTKLHKGSKVDVTFDISFYLVSAAGSMAVFAVACNCFRRYPMYEEPPYNRMDEHDDLESIIPPGEPDMAPMDSLPPPPAYTVLPNTPSTSATHPTTGHAHPETGHAHPATGHACELPSYAESIGSTQSLSAVPALQPTSASLSLSSTA